MKTKIIYFLMVSSISLYAYAEETTERREDTQSQRNNPGSSGRRSKGADCHYRLTQQRQEILGAQGAVKTAAEVSGAADRATPAGIDLANKQRQLGEKVVALEMNANCRSLEIASAANKESLDQERDSFVSSDQKIGCSKAGGYTLDWQSCKSAVSAYNMVVTAEATMDLAHQVRTAQSTNKMSREVASRAAEGDAQNAAFDASIKHKQNLSNMNKEKLAGYVAAMGVLGSKIYTWQDKSVSDLQKLCAGVDRTMMGPAPIDSKNAETVTLDKAKLQLMPQVLPAECPKKLAAIRRETFSNEPAKGLLTAAFMQYMQKAALAGFASNELDKLAKKVEQAKNGTEDPGPGMFDRCAVAPNDPACGPTGPRTPGSEYTGGDFSIGEGIGSNAFGPDALTDTEIKLEDPLALPEGEKISDASSPFVDEAKEASGIMDPAGAANAQASGGAGSGGGGGGSGGGGGGSASLGSDLQGPDAGNKDANVKAGKSGGNYNFAGGGGFQAVKPMKDDANPFSSLFDSKSQGGLEEDRSIASDDIGGKDSGLFLRISRRYNKITDDKRIEALNLE